MNCKFCGQPLPEDSTSCPHCGWDSISQPETSPEEQVFEETVEIVPPETEADDAMEQAEEVLAPEVKKMKRTAAISGCIAVLAVLAAVLFFGIRGTFSADGKGWDLSSITLFRENDIFKQDSYTVSDSKAQKKADTVVATVGGAELTNSQLQIYYQMEILEFLNQYGYLLSYMGLDFAQPLDQQQCMLAENLTWEQFFLENALLAWKQNQVLALEAEKNQFQLDEETRSYLEELDSSMETLASNNGYDSADAMMQAEFGSNTALADWEEYMDVSMRGLEYFYERCQAIETPSDEALEDYFRENQQELEKLGIKKDAGFVMDVRHILIEVEGGVENEDGTITFPDAALAAAAKTEAEEILAQWLENPTEESFAALAKAHSKDSGSSANGGLYADLTPGRMVKPFDDWCFDTDRQKGDYGIVETRFGYHIMFCSRRGEDIWLTQTRQAYLSQQQTAILEELLAGYEMKVSYGKIALIPVDLG